MKLLTYEQAAKLYDCGRSRLQKAVSDGKIDAYRPGKKIKLDADSVEAWFQSTKIKPRIKRGRPRTGAKRI